MKTTIDKKTLTLHPQINNSPRSPNNNSLQQHNTIMKLFGIFGKKDDKVYDKGLEKTQQNIFAKLKRAVAGKTTIDDDVLDDVEEALITSDVGVDTTLKIIRQLEDRVAKDKYTSTQELQYIIYDEIEKLITDTQQPISDTEYPSHKPYVILVVGVNGVGKTTTIAKLAHRFKSQGMSVMLGAADTFRAAAIDQLKIWAERVNVPVVSQKMGADPASVAYDTLASAKANNIDVVIVDTAGRLHNKVGLMNELKKIKNVMQRIIPNAPHEVMLVLDGSTGQNAYEQAKQFAEVTQINSLAITKLDGTAKGGVVIGIVDQMQIPVKYIGLGEGLDDLQEFDPHTFVSTIFNKTEE